MRVLVQHVEPIWPGTVPNQVAQQLHLSSTVGAALENLI